MRCLFRFLKASTSSLSGSSMGRRGSAGNSHTSVAEVLERPASYEPPTLRDQLLARPVARRVLLLAGIVRPQRGLDARAWWLPWILWRAAIAATMLFYLFLLVVYLFDLVDHDTWSIVACAVIATRAPERLRGAHRARSSSSSGWLPP